MSEIIVDPRQYLDGILDVVEKKYGNADDMEDVEKLSTGLLCHDLMIGGGILPAMYTNAGWEQSAKTTNLLSTLVSAIKSNIPYIGFWDAEGSTRNSIPYLLNIAQLGGVNMTRDELFGKRDPKTGKWLKRGVIDYRTVTKGDTFFNSVTAMIRRMPDRMTVNGKWYSVFPKKEYPEMSEYHDNSTKRKDAYYVPCSSGLQGIIFIDSWSNLQPTAKDEDEDNQGLAADARMYAAGLKRFIGYLASKKVALYGVNQLRALPMVTYGPKEQEAGGNALRFQSSVRLRFTERALSGAPFNPVPHTRSPFEKERGIDGGIDVYKYIHVRAVKNKLSEPYRETWMRVWVRDEYGKARGLDPVFDTINYLVSTGQATIGGRDARNRIGLNLMLPNGSPMPREGDALTTWGDLKLWILGEESEGAEIAKELGYPKGFNLRNLCFAQIQSGIADSLHEEATTGTPKTRNEDDDDHEEEELYDEEDDLGDDSDFD